MQSLVSDTIEQIRTLAHQLRPAALEEFGLPVALEALVEDMVNQESLQASCDCRVTRGEIPNEIEAVLYRIAQEGLTNVVRHSQASNFNLIVEKNGQDFLLTIEDDGIGFDPTALGTKNGKRHLGLISMKERAEMLGGGFDVYTAPGKGTLIRVSIPTGDI
jgi:signal transduction histidine kinase